MFAVKLLFTYRYVNKEEAFLLNNIFAIRSDTGIHIENIRESAQFLLEIERLRVLGGGEFVSLSLEVITGLGISQLPVVGSKR